MCYILYVFVRWLRFIGDVVSDLGMSSFALPVILNFGDGIQIELYLTFRFTNVKSARGRKDQQQISYTDINASVFDLWTIGFVVRWRTRWSE